MITRWLIGHEIVMGKNGKTEKATQRVANWLVGFLKRAHLVQPLQDFFGSGPGSFPDVINDLVAHLNTANGEGVFT